jgi:exodeoxyribonuclease-1
MSFVFYDTETTGTDTVFDQILQFAAIRTDEELSELDRFSIRCRLLPHVVPSPGAMRVTGVSVAELISAELPTHYAMVRAIRAKLRSWSPALFVGYNSLGFDEHLLRQAFYQTLHPPYLTNTGRNCRADVLRMIRATALFAPNTITVPLDESGSPTFKLDKLAPANGFDHVDAHDAIADVQATLHLCKLLSERVPDLWSSFLRFTQKAAVVDHVTNERNFCLTDFYGGKAYSWLVTSIGLSPSRSSDVLVFDLAIDPEQLISFSDDELIAQLAQSPKTIRRVRSNACPIIMPADKAPDIAAAKALGTQEVERRTQLLQNDAVLRQRFVIAFEQTRDVPGPWPHVEQRIYDSFISSGDERRLELFHNLPWEQRLALLDQIEDLRLKQLGRRLIFVERPDVISDRLRGKMTIALAQRLINADGAWPWLCLQRAIREADDLITLAPDEQKTFLREHRCYLVKRLEEMTACIA